MMWGQRSRRYEEGNRRPGLSYRHKRQSHGELRRREVVEESSRYT